MDNTLIISDCHAPYQHPDTLPFLKEVKYAYDIKDAKCVGDIVDNHSGNFHPTEYATLSAKEEFTEAKKFVQSLNKIFPAMTVTLGNHDIMSERKAKKYDIPLDALRSYNDMYEIEGWEWVDKDFFKVDEYNDCLMTHAMSKSTLTNAKNHSHHSVQGHFHGTYGLEYFADTKVLRWSMTVGCLIDTSSPAFNYSKGYSNNKPVIGVGIIWENIPILVPMQLDKNGRWNGKI